MRQTLKYSPIYPILLGIYPVLNLYASNLGYALFRWAVLPVCLILIAVVVLLTGSLLVLRDKARAGLFTGLLVLFFFSYGQFFGLADPVLGQLGLFGRNRYLLTIYVIAFGAAAWLILEKGHRWREATPTLNVACVSLLILTAARLVVFRIDSAAVNPKPFLELPALQPNGSLRDIYYIVLDGYARGDVLRNCYGFDNDAFLSDLQRRGFYIVEGSRSNYAMTLLSISSILNMVHLDQLFGETTEEKDKTTILAKSIENNAVEHALKGLGYTLVRTPSGFPYTHFSRFVDVNYGANIIPGDFNAMLIWTTLARPIVQQGALLPHLSSAQFLSVFDSVEELPKISKPIFAFIHIVSPHPPYSFDRNGNPAPFGANVGDAWANKAGYVEQVMFLNKRVGAMVSKLISDSKLAPIIIIQGDHGPICHPDEELNSDENLRERVENLNAFYLPGEGPRNLYRTITSVNTFRVVFNTYFNANLSMEEDKSFFSHWRTPYQFVPIK